MEANLIKFEPWIRLSCFALFLMLFIWAEQKKPWRYHAKHSIRERLEMHMILLMVSSLLVRAAAPVMLVGLALQVRAEHAWAVLAFPELQKVPFWFQVLLGIVWLDFVMYWQHRVMHRIGLLWRLHLVHHTDKKLDASTGIRFHPIEFLFSYGFKMLAIIFFGPPAIAVLIFEILLNAASMFTHSNIAIPKTWDKRLRWFIVTPHMHRVHHSDIEHERNCNFGFFLSVWDRLLKTYRANSRMGEQRIVIGVEEFLPQPAPTLWQILYQPFVLKKKRRRKPLVRRWMQPSQGEG